MDPLTWLAIGGMATGFLGKIFGANPEDEYRKRKAAAADALRAAKTKAMDRITRLITGQTSSNIAQVTQGGTERAVSMGRPDAAEALIQPQVSKVATAGSESLQRGIGQVNSDYDQQLANLELSGLDRPTQPNAGDYIAELGKGVGDFAGMQAYLDAVKPGTVEAAGALPTTMVGPKDILNAGGAPNPIPENPAISSGGMASAYEEPTQFQGLPYPMRKKKMDLQGAYMIPNYTDARRGG